MIQRKAGRKPVAARALTAVEKTQRQRAVVRITNEELEKVGCRPLAINIPAVYLRAMRAYEAGFQMEPNFVDVIAFSSGWICKALEDFIRAEAENSPDSEVAKIFHSDEWIASNQIRYEVAALNAKIAIAKFIKEQNERISNESSTEAQ